MSTPNDHDIKVLNGLIETTLDSVDGYREAATETQDPHYRTLFERRCDERRRVVDDLSAAVRGMGTGDIFVSGCCAARGTNAFLQIEAPQPAARVRGAGNDLSRARHAFLGDAGILADGAFRGP